MGRRHGGKSGGFVAQVSARKGTDTHARGIHAEKGKKGLSQKASFFLDKALLLTG